METMKKESGVIQSSGKGQKIGIAVARFNAGMTRPLLDGARRVLKRQGVRPSDVRVAWVPGAFELPLALQRMARSGKYSALIALGAVIRGETPHFDYVCRGATDGVMRVMLDTGIPIAFGILTTDNVEQATDRIGGRHGHKGEEAALVALEMAKVGNRG